MAPKVSLIIPTYERDNLLALGLKSIARQNLDGVEVLVFNDGTRGGPEDLCAKYGFRCIYTGDKDMDLKDLPAGEKHPWRPVSFIFNLGAKLAQAPVLILTNAEIYHIGQNCIADLVLPLATDEMALCIPEVGKDDDGRFLANPDEALFDSLPPLVNIHLPFFMAFMRKHFIAIGGFDMDFNQGRWYEDNDFVDRMQLYGCHYVKTQARCIHVHHQHVSSAGNNLAIYWAKHGKIVRNEGRHLFD